MDIPWLRSETVGFMRSVSLQQIPQLNHYLDVSQWKHANRFKGVRCLPKHIARTSGYISNNTEKLELAKEPVIFPSILRKGGDFVKFLLSKTNRSPLHEKPVQKETHLPSPVFCYFCIFSVKTTPSKP